MITIQEIIKDIKNFGSDDITFGFQEGGIHLQQIPEEMAECIYDLIKQDINPKNFMEIGSAAGGAIFLFNHFFKFEKVYIIDDNQHKKFKIRNEILKDIDHIDFIGDSHSKEALDFMNSLNPEIDFLFIDGDHSYDGVKKDTEMYIHLLKNGGYLFFHDTMACQGVRKWFNELKTQNEFGIIFIKEYAIRLGIGLFKKNI